MHEMVKFVVTDRLGESQGNYYD